VIPETKALRHADSLDWLLRDIDLACLGQAHVDLMRRLIRGQGCRRLLITHCHPVAGDGSQKLTGDNPLGGGTLAAHRRQG